MKLDIKHWQLLLAIQLHGTLGKAAQHLNMTQSALSHRLAEAERRLGQPIFDREGRVLRLTPAGKLLVEAAKRHLPALSQAEYRFEEMAGRKRHLVRLGVAHYSSYHWVSSYVQSLTFSRERLQIDFVTAAIQSPLESLRNGAADLLIYPGDYRDDVIEGEKLFSDELVLVTHPNHPLTEKRHIIAEDLQQETYLTYSLTETPGFEFERFFKPSGLSPSRVQVIEMTDAIVELIIARQGISILSRWALSRTLEQGLLKAVSLGPLGLPLDWSVLTRVSDQSHQAVQLARKSLRRHFQGSTTSA